MQATRALRIASTAAARVSATPVARAGGELVAKANPNLLKVWKSYSYTRNQRIQQLSPFEIDVLGPLFRNIGHKIKHKVEDNFWDVAPPIIFFILLITATNMKRKDILMHHRD